MFTNTYRPHVGGVARAVATLVDEHRRAGHAVLVVAPSFPGDEHEHDQGVVRVPAWQNFNGSDFSVRVPLPRLIARRIQAFAPEVVHSHHPFLLGDAALRSAYAEKLPLVFTHHTLYEHYTHYVPFDSRPLKRFVVRLATAYANCCDEVIAPSESVADLLRRRGVHTETVVVPTGVDTARFHDADGANFRAERGLPAEAPVLGHVGRLAREKNLGLLADAVAQALKRRPDLYFVLVGHGPESPRLHRRFERAGVADQVVTTGKLSGQPLVDAYAAMDLFVFASQTETQGMVVAEAMAAATPVVALDGPGVRDVVADGHNGRLVDADVSAAGFADALIAAIADPRCRCWRRGAQSTAQTLDQRRCAERVRDLYARAQPSHRRATTVPSWIDRLRGRIQAEWELAASKAESAGNSVGGRKGHIQDSEH